MKSSEDAYSLRVFLGESDKSNGIPLYEAIVRLARELHAAGATVLRGPMGYGAGNCVHTAKVLRLSEDLPVIVEIVDGKEKIDELVARIGAMMGGGMMTIAPVSVLRYGPD